MDATNSDNWDSVVGVPAVQGVEKAVKRVRATQPPNPTHHTYIPKFEQDGARAGADSVHHPVVRQLRRRHSSHLDQLIAWERAARPAAEPLERRHLFYHRHAVLVGGKKKRGMIRGTECGVEDDAEYNVEDDVQHLWGVMG